MVIMMSGLDYSLAPIELREQLSFTKAQVGALAERIRSSSPPATAPSSISLVKRGWSSSRERCSAPPLA